MVKGNFRSPNSDLVRAISLLLGSRSCRLTTSLNLSCTVEVAQLVESTKVASRARASIGSWFRSLSVSPALVPR